MKKSLLLTCFSLAFLVLGVLVLFKSISPKPIVCANSISCAKNLNVQVENNSVGIFNNQKITPPKILLTDSDLKPKVLADTTGADEKHIYVDLTKQTLAAYEGAKLYFQTLISSGKWHDTPTGDFRIWVKLRATRMTGGSGADFYDLPNVPFVMFFAGNNASQGAGYSLHGAYWHDNFGHAMSHGCVNMRQVDAEKLYNWVNPITEGYTTYANAQDQGTKVTIYGQAPI